MSDKVTRERVEEIRKRAEGYTCAEGNCGQAVWELLEYIDQQQDIHRKQKYDILTYREEVAALTAEIARLNKELSQTYDCLLILHRCQECRESGASSCCHHRVYTAEVIGRANTRIAALVAYKEVK